MSTFLTAFVVVLMLLPVHIFYYYSLANWVVPNNLNKKHCATLVLGIIACCIVSTLLFRIIEITIADPYILRQIQLTDPSFHWKKLDGSFLAQLTHPVYLVNALEQSNTVIWIAISAKYFKMWLERRQAILQSEVDFLKANLHPHFLFNTLNNLYALSLERSYETPNIVLGLSTILRYMLYECNATSVLLQRDIEILNSYIVLEKIRYQDRLQLAFNIQGLIEHQRIPPLLIFPLIENAFKEGLSETVDDPWININLAVDAGKLKLNISHSLPKLKIVNQAESFEQNGLKHLIKKLETQFSGGYRLHTQQDTEVSVTVMELDLDKRY